jgi:hypothetical protein
VRWVVPEVDAHEVGRAHVDLVRDVPHRVVNSDGVASPVPDTVSVNACVSEWVSGREIAYGSE